VRQYELEQRMLQDEKEDALRRQEDALIESEIARLEQANSRLARFEREHLSGSTPPPFTEDSCS
jgi:hypothetical protein